MVNVNVERINNVQMQKYNRIIANNPYSDNMCNISCFSEVNKKKIFTIQRMPILSNDSWQRAGNIWRFYNDTTPDKSYYHYRLNNLYKSNIEKIIQPIQI